MRNLPLTVTLCCATFLALPSTAVELKPNTDLIERPITDDTIVDVKPIQPETPIDSGELDVDLKLPSEDNDNGLGNILDEGKDFVDTEIDPDEVVTGESDGSVITGDKLLSISCRSTDCEALGYSQKDVEGCLAYVKCPFDENYQVCTKYDTCEKSSTSVAVKVRNTIIDVLSTTEDKLCDSANLKTDLGADSLDLIDLRMALEEEFDRDIPDNVAEDMATVKDIIDFFSSEEYTLTECPEGAICFGRFKLTKCIDGYTLKNNSCVANTSCPVGYELGTVNTTGFQDCYPSACGALLLTGGVREYATLSSGKRVVVSCDVGYREETTTKGCTTCKLNSSGSGSDSSSSSECQCQYGYYTKTDGTKACCGSNGKDPTDPNGFRRCIRCSSV